MKWIRLNLVLRLLLLFWVLGSSGHHWTGGDTHTYLRNLNQMIEGVWGWGGEPHRVPLYYWLLRISSWWQQPPVGELASSFAGILLLQTLLAWGAGYWLYRRTGHLTAALIWLYEPSTFVYGALVMTDSLFGSLMLFALVAWYELVRGMDFGSARKSKMFSMGVGLLAGLVALTRPNGYFLFLMLSVLSALTLSRRAMVSFWGLAFLVWSFVLAPRVAFNKQHYGYWGLSEQAGALWQDTASIILFYDKGWDFQTCNQNFSRYWADRAREPGGEKLAGTWWWISDVGRFLHIVAEKPGAALILQFKSMARVLFGHVNLEWSQTLFGFSPIGPAWTRPQENRPGDRVGGIGLLLWILGLLTSLIYTSAVYYHLFSAGRLSRGVPIPRFVWGFLICGLVFAAMPPVVADARFRNAVWPWVVMALVGFNAISSRSENSHG